VAYRSVPFLPSLGTAFGKPPTASVPLGPLLFELLGLKLGHGAWNPFRAGGLYSPALGYSNAAGGPDGHTPLPPVGCLN